MAVATFKAVSRRAVAEGKLQRSMVGMGGTRGILDD
jgi:hypothetical protein